VSSSQNSNSVRNGVVRSRSFMACGVHFVKLTRQGFIIGRSGKDLVQWLSVGLVWQRRTGDDLPQRLSMRFVAQVVGIHGASGDRCLEIARKVSSVLSDDWRVETLARIHTATTSTAISDVGAKQ